ncbi:hypothetical protein QYS48_19745 [Marivirga arenosa]|uniref:Uncharacterized protein n=1 Tax=Marivirga arenosa TaxID=3059076 RepID=A0AA49GFJ6_9BACT|nr:hypothetical protein [Marivirga sp. ABR2-2]WKK84392.2 hypothetical protein QYS48_19745 [Marivirga sp. ABR2-2]
MELVIYHNYQSVIDKIEAYIKVLRENELNYDSQELQSLGLKHKDQIHSAIEKTQQILYLAGEDLNFHIKIYYVDKNGVLSKAWRLSKLAYTLCLLKADVFDYEGANLQTLMANKISNLFLDKDRFKSRKYKSSTFT